MFCCSVALYFCVSGRYQFCTPCHNDAMSGVTRPKTDCTGGPDCPLGLEKHPKADTDVNKSKFSLGCAVCRSEKLHLVAKNEKASGGYNMEKRDHMIARF